MTPLTSLLSLRNRFIVQRILTTCTYVQRTMHVHSKWNYVITIYMYMYCIERSVTISITRITRVNNICSCYVAISDDIFKRADFQVDGYHGCWFLLVILIHNTLLKEITISSTWTTRDKGKIRKHVHSKWNYVITLYMYMYCIERNVNISITRIARVNNICFCYVADISSHANILVEEQRGFWVGRGTIEQVLNIATIAETRQKLGLCTFAALKRRMILYNIISCGTSGNRISCHLTC